MLISQFSYVHLFPNTNITLFIIQAPNPKSIKPQAATGQDKESSPKKVHNVPPPFDANQQKNHMRQPSQQQQRRQQQPPQHQSLPHPIQQLANSYNDSQRPLPYRQIPPSQKPAPPTIINNYYYVQPPQSSSPMLPMSPMSPVLPMGSPTQVPSTNTLPHQNFKQQKQQQNYSSNSLYKSSSNSYSDSSQKKTPVSYSNRQRSSMMNTSSHSSLRGSIDGDNESASYESFIKKGSNNSHRKRSPRKESSIASLYGESKHDIYSSSSLLSDEPRPRTQYNRHHSNDLAKLPDINIDPEYELSDKLEEMTLKKHINLIKELGKLENESISVHNKNFFNLFDSCCVVGNSLTLEQLGAVLYDPYHKNNRFSFKSLGMIMDTFVSKTSNGEMDFRCFVKMCKFVKGCFESFNYHDTRGDDHVLDFEEFRKALKSNNIKCSDFLLATIFKDSEYIDLEHYIIDIILIRKEEKKH